MGSIGAGGVSGVLLFWQRMGLDMHGWAWSGCITAWGSVASMFGVLRNLLYGSYSIIMLVI